MVELIVFAALVCGALGVVLIGSVVGIEVLRGLGLNALAVARLAWEAMTALPAAARIIWRRTTSRVPRR